jgi:hypothetical protein
MAVAVLHHLLVALQSLMRVVAVADSKLLDLVVLAAADKADQVIVGELRELQILVVAQEVAVVPEVQVLQVVRVLSLLKPTKLLALAVKVAVAVTSLINQLNKVLNIFSNKEEF